MSPPFPEFEFKILTALEHIKVQGHYNANLLQEMMKKIEVVYGPETEVEEIQSCHLLL